MITSPSERKFAADVCPRFACVRWTCTLRLMRNVAANAGLGAGINYIGIGIGNGDRADRGDGLFFEDPRYYLHPWNQAYRPRRSMGLAEMERQQL